MLLVSPVLVFFLHFTTEKYGKSRREARHFFRNKIFDILTYEKEHERLHFHGRRSATDVG